MTGGSTLQDVLSQIRSHRDELQRRGVRHLSVFGSIARGDFEADSDVDLLVDLDQGIVRSLVEYASIQSFLQDILGRPVDLAERGRLKAHVRETARSDLVDAF